MGSGAGVGIVALSSSFSSSASSASSSLTVRLPTVLPTNTLILLFPLPPCYIIITVIPHFRSLGRIEKLLRMYVCMCVMHFRLYWSPRPTCLRANEGGGRGRGRAVSGVRGSRATSTPPFSCTRASPFFKITTFFSSSSSSSSSSSDGDSVAFARACVPGVELANHFIVCELRSRRRGGGRSRGARVLFLQPRRRAGRGTCRS